MANGIDDNGDGGGWIAPSTDKKVVKSESKKQKVDGWLAPSTDKKVVKPKPDGKKPVKKKDPTPSGTGLEPSELETPSTEQIDPTAPVSEDEQLDVDKPFLNQSLLDQYFLDKKEESFEDLQWKGLKDTPEYARFVTGKRMDKQREVLMRTEQRTVNKAAQQTLKIFNENPVYQEENPDYKENREKFLESLASQGIDKQMLYNAVGEDYTPAAMESIVNSINNMGTQIEGTPARLVILTTSIYEEVFGDELARELYSGEDGRTLDESRLWAQKELRELGEQTEVTRGFIESYDKGDTAGFVVSLFDAITSVGATVVTSIPSGGATIFSDAIGGSINSYNATKADILGITEEELYATGQDEVAIPSSVGLLSGLLEKVGLKGMTKAMNKKLLTKEGWKNASAFFLQNNKEGLTEVVQLGLDEYANALAEGKTHEEAIELAADKLLSEEAGEVYLKGFVGSTAISGTTSVLRDRKKQAVKEQSELEIEEKKAEVDGRTKDQEIFRANAEQKAAEVNEIENEQANALAEDAGNKTEVELGKKEVARLKEEQAKPNMSTTGKEALQAQIDLINEYIKPKEDAIQKPEAEGVPVQPEAERREEVRREDPEREAVAEEVKAEEKIEERVVTELPGEAKVKAPETEPFDGKDYSKGKKSEEIAEKEGVKFTTPEEAERHIAEKSENPQEMAESFERTVKKIPEAEQKDYKAQVIEESNIKITPEEFKQYSDPKLASKRMDAKFIDSKRKTPLDAKLKEISEDAGIEITPDDFADYMRGFEQQAEAPTEVGTLPMLRERFKELTGKTLTPKLAGEITAAAKVKADTAKKVEAISQEFEEQVAGEQAALEAKGKPKEVKAQPISELSGIKKKLVPPEVQAKVDWNTVSDKEMMEIGRNLRKSGELDVENIITEVQIEPRALQPQEVAGLIDYKAELDSDFNAAFARKAEKAANNKSTAVEDAQIQEIQDKIYNYQAMSLITAQQMSLAFRLRQYLRDSNTFDVVKAINQYKAANDGFISKKVKEQLEAYDQKAKELVKRINELEAEREAKVETEAFQNIVDDVERKPKPKKKVKPKEVAKKVADKIRKLKIHKPKMFLAATPASLAWDAAVETVAKTVEVGGALANGILAGKQKIIESDWYKKLSKKLKKDALDGFDGWAKENLDHTKIEVKEKDGTLSIPAKLIRAHVANGVKDINQLTDIIYEQVVAELPDITKREVRDAITGYGKTVNLSKDEISIETRKIKRIGKLISALEDARLKKRPLRSGLQRDKITDKERLMKAELNELLKDVPISDKETATAWKSALDGMKSRLKNRIKDLETQIKEGKKPKAKKGIKLDEEAIGLKERRDALQKQLDLLVGKPEMSEEQRVNNAIKSAERSIREIESQIEKGGLLKRAKDKLKPTAELVAIRKKRDAAKADLDALRDARGIADHLVLTKTKKRLGKQLAEYKRMIAEKDFAKKKPKTTELVDDQLLELRSQIEQVKAEVGKIQHEIEEANKTFSEKAKDAIAEVFSALPRVFIASMDLSAIGVQGFLKMWRHPIESLKGLRTSVKQMVSQEHHDKMLAKLKAMPTYPAMKKAGLALLESDYKLTVKEEQFLGNWINHIWNAPANLIEVVTGEIALTRGFKKFNPYKASERAYAGFLNHIRVASFERFARGLESEGITPQNNPEAYKRAAKVVNASTGRGSLGAFEGANTLLSTLFFSVRRLTSTVQILEPLYSLSMPMEVRKMAILDLMVSLTGIATATMLAQAAFGDEDDEDEFLDPDSSNFMKVKIRGEDGSFTTVGLAGPLHSLVTTISRSLSGKFRSATTGEIEYLGERGPMKSLNSRADVIKAYFWNKKAPGIAIMEKILDQRKGRELDSDKFWAETMLPIWMQDVSEVFEDHPTEAASLLTSLNMLGISSQHFQLTKAQRRAKRKASTKSDRNKRSHEKYLRKLERQAKKK